MSQIVSLMIHLLSSLYFLTVCKNFWVIYLFAITTAFAGFSFFPLCESPLKIPHWCHVHTLCRTSKGLYPTLWFDFEEYSMYRTLHHCSSEEEFIWESSLCHSVTVSIGVCLISPEKQPSVVIVACSNCAQHTVLTMLSVVLAVYGYWTAMAVFTLCHTTLVAARIKIKTGLWTAQHVESFFSLRLDLQKQQVDLVITDKPVEYFSAEFGS